MIAQWTPLHQQAVEVMARTIRTYEREFLEALWVPVEPRRQNIASLFIGHLEALNNRTLAEIVRTVEEADCRFISADGKHYHPRVFNDDYAMERSVACAPIDSLAFFTVCVLEGIAKGERSARDRAVCPNDAGIDCSPIPIPSWFDAHPRLNPPIIVPALWLDIGKESIL